jgi:hypothetical protein
MKSRASSSVLLLLIAFVLAGCAGAGPSSGTAAGRPRCASGGQDDQRPLFFIFCVESP